MTLVIETIHTLSADQVMQIKELEAVIQANDGIKKNIYLSNQFNENQAMPSFFLAYLDQELVGVLGVYADELPLAEVTIFVSPAYRNQGIASQLIRRAFDTIQSYGITELIYIAEKQFMDQHQLLTRNWLFKPEASELLLELGRFPTFPKQEQIKVSVSKGDEIEALSSIHVLAFESELAYSKQYIEASLKDPQIQQWTIRYEDQIVGTLSIDTESKVDFYFGVAIAPAYQGKGIGKNALNQILQLRNSLKPQQLVVEVGNQAAINLYKSNGFVEIAEIRYIEGNFVRK